MNYFEFSINNYLLKFVPEQLRSVEEILDEIDALNNEFAHLRKNYLYEVIFCAS